jgi:hypothetical protein
MGDILPGQRIFPVIYCIVASFTHVLSKMYVKRAYLIEGHKVKLKQKTHMLHKYRHNSQINVDLLDKDMILKNRKLAKDSAVFKRFNYLYTS